ncbi:hypothetical protein [Dietzia cinnamea]|uniref:hypothetical protein n=1 Tax=Dietzia cinnamea TaxID=321318 RepID=UPI0021A97641|nr:hypothetical protein [Dietzia cinnamea]MCT2140156.1 hypothetical protein [Dietzia cinnamea]
MRNRVLLSAGAIALVAASCAQPEPQVLSEAPRSASATELTSPTATTDRDEQPGKFIARCATEADGGTPGMTIFTDGSQDVTDHCLSRYYIGVQPAPGALYVPDEEAGTYAPPSETATAQPTGEQWTPAQPRTDSDPLETELVDGRETLDDETTTDRPGEPGTDDPDDSGTPGTDEPGSTTPGTSPGATTPTSPSPTPDPGGTEPGGTEPGQSEPGLPDPSVPGGTEPSTTGSSDPTSVPTEADLSRLQPPAPQTSVPPTRDSGSLGSAGSDASGEPRTSVGFPGFRWPGSFWPGGPRS